MNIVTTLNVLLISSAALAMTGWLLLLRIPASAPQRTVSPAAAPAQKTWPSYGLPRSARIRRASAPFLAAVSVTVVIGFSVVIQAVIARTKIPSPPPSSVIPLAPACQTRFPAILYIKASSPSPATTTTVAACRFKENRTYLIVEKVINVSSSTHPHPVYFVKATLPRLRSGQTETSRFVLKEPRGTEAEFFVLSVDPAGLAALGRHQVADHGILRLPPGAVQESAVETHTKT
jgi:hypothetical protein